MRTSSFWRAPLLLSCSLALLAGCAPAAAEGGATTGASASTRLRANLITREELESSGTTNLYDAVQRLRPQWLRNAANTSYSGGGAELVVYQGTSLLGGVETLRQFAPGYAVALRYLDASTATNTLPGLGSRRVAGAIVIELPR